MQSQELAAFNTLLGSNHLDRLQVSPIALTALACGSRTPATPVNKASAAPAKTSAKK